MNDIVASLLTAIAGGIPAVIAVVLSNRSHDKVIDERMKNMSERIKELSIRVEKHNNLVERMALVEQSLKAEHKRLDNLSTQLQIIEKQK